MENKIIELIIEACDTQIIYEKRDIDLFKTGLLDSMSFIELLMAIEDEFDMEIEPIEIQKEKMSTPNQLIEFVKGRINDK